MNMEEVKDNLNKNNIVVCGALRYVPDSTSDGTAANLAHFLDAEFINMTNVDGLFTANPLTHKNAKLIPSINWKDFKKRALAMKFHAGQHFVLDQAASILIREHKIKTYILGPKLDNLNNVLNNRKFRGTLIEG